MALRGLARLHELDRHLQGAAGRFHGRKAGVDELDRAAVVSFACVPDGHGLARLLEALADDRPRPEPRYQLRARLPLLPVRGQRVLGQASVQRF